MAQQWEVKRAPDFVPHPDLRKKSVVKRLIDEGRPPFLMAYDGEMQLERPVCFIPAANSMPAETFEVSHEDAGKIASIRDKLQRQH